jgi:hypothetical protein
MTLVPTIEHPHPSGTNPRLPPDPRPAVSARYVPIVHGCRGRARMRGIRSFCASRDRHLSRGLGAPSNVRQRTVAKTPVTRSTPPLLRRRPTKVDFWSWYQRITSRRRDKTHRAGPVLRRRSPLRAPVEDLPRTRRRKSSPCGEAFEVPGIHIDLGRLDAGEVIGPVDPVVVQESTTDDMPLVDDRAVELGHHPQPVCRMGGSNVGVCRAPASSSDVRPPTRPYRGALNERCCWARPHVNGRRGGGARAEREAQGWRG